MKNNRTLITTLVLLLTLFTSYGGDSSTNEAHTVKIIIPHNLCAHINSDGSVDKINVRYYKAVIFDSFNVSCHRTYSDSLYDYLFFNFNHNNYFYIDWKNVKTFSMRLFLGYDKNSTMADTTYVFDEIDNVVYFKTCQASDKPLMDRTRSVLNADMIKSLEEDRLRKKYVEDSIVKSTCEHIMYKDIDSIVLSSSKRYKIFDTVKVIGKTKRYPSHIDTVHTKLNIVDSQKFTLKKEFYSNYVRDNLYELTDSLLKNYRPSAYSKKQISTFPNDSSFVSFHIYFSSTSQIIVSSWNWSNYSYNVIMDGSRIRVSRDERNIKESTPSLNPIHGTTHHARDYWTETSLYKDIINETFNELAVYYNSIESDSSKHVKLLAKPIPIPIK